MAPVSPPPSDSPGWGLAPGSGVPEGTGAGSALGRLPNHRSAAERRKSGAVSQFFSCVGDPRSGLITAAMPSPKPVIPSGADPITVHAAGHLEVPDHPI